MADLPDDEVVWLATLYRFIAPEDVPALDGIQARLRDLHADLAEARSQGAQDHASDVYLALVAAGLRPPAGHHGAIEAVSAMIAQVAAREAALRALAERCRESFCDRIQCAEQCADLCAILDGRPAGQPAAGPTAAPAQVSHATAIASVVLRLGAIGPDLPEAAAFAREAWERVEAAYRAAPDAPWDGGARATPTHRWFESSPTDLEDEAIRTAAVRWYAAHMAPLRFAALGVPAGLIAVSTEECSECGGTGIAHHSNSPPDGIVCDHCGGEVPSEEPIVPPEPGPWEDIDHIALYPIRFWSTGKRAAFVGRAGWAVCQLDGSVYARGTEVGRPGRDCADRVLDAYRAECAGLTEHGWTVLSTLAEGGFGVLGPTNTRALVALGWLDADGRVTDAGRAALARRRT